MNDEKVRELIQEQCELPLEEIVPEALLDDDLGLDSLDQTELVMAIEEEFSLPISDEADELETVQQVYDYVNKHAKGG